MTMKMVSTEELGDHDGAPGGNPDNQGDQGKDDGEGCSHRSQRFFPQETSHNNLIYKGIELLEHMSHQHGHGKTQYVLAHATFGKIFHSGFHCSDFDGSPKFVNLS
jgi:hypothetical protein